MHSASPAPALRGPRTDGAASSSRQEAYKAAANGTAYAAEPHALLGPCAAAPGCDAADLQAGPRALAISHDLPRPSMSFDELR